MSLLSKRTRRVALTCSGWIFVALVQACGAAGDAPGAAAAPEPEALAPIVTAERTLVQESPREPAAAVQTSSAGPRAPEVVHTDVDVPRDPSRVARWARECASGRDSLRWAEFEHGPGDFSRWQESVRSFARCALRDRESTLASSDIEYDGAVRVAASVTRYHVTYPAPSAAGATGPVERIPAFLFVPNTDRPVPAVIVYHGHGPGKIAAAERIEHQPESAIALEIATRLGYVVLAPDTRNFGEFADHRHDAYWRSLVASDSTDAFIARAVADGASDPAVLRSRPEVDPARIGTAGVSMGSWRALLFAVMHPEIRAVVVSALYLPFSELFTSRHDPCQHVPALAATLDMQDLALSLVGRSMLVQWGGRDGAFVPAARALLETTRAAFRSVGAADDFVVDVDPTRDHQFGVPGVIAFLRQRLGQGAWTEPD